MQQRVVRMEGKKSRFNQFSWLALCFVQAALVGM
jgi:hypothetical protein